MTTLVEPVLTASGFSDGTARLPRRLSPASRRASADSQIFVLLVPGDAGPPERFFVVSVTLIVAPTPADAGAVSAETVRSGFLLKAAVQVLSASIVTAPIRAVRVTGPAAKDVGRPRRR